MKFTAQGSRFNFTIKGPKLWGAQITGFIEMDFDSAETTRCRHVLYRFQLLHASPASRHVPVQLAHHRTAVRPVLVHVLRMVC